MGVGINSFAASGLREYHQLLWSASANLRGTTKLLWRIWSACAHRIPPVQPDPSKPGLLFYRGISASKRAAVAAKYQPQGQTIHWSGMSSVTSDLDIARQFAGSDGVLFVITCRSARDVSELSAIPAEREALLLPNFRATVVQPLQAPQADDKLRISVVELLEQVGSGPRIDI
eukprot:433247-Amphidinium_carterae.3